MDLFLYKREREEKNATLQANPSEVWLDDQDAAAILRVSKRTMQRLRSNGEITYSISGNKAWYTLAEVRRLLSSRVVRNDKQEGGKP
jgi:hypothetical protein